MAITTTNEQLSTATYTALKAFNHDYNASWSLGANWSSVNTEFETFINKYLFPKLNETALIHHDLGNRFEWLAKEIDFVGQYSEEYVILDTVPVAMNLNKEEELMLKRNYPDMATKIYGNGIVKKTKFTLNNNDVRFNWQTLADGVSYSLGVYKKRISDINVNEEKEIKSMLVDYALNVTKDVREAQSFDDLVQQTYRALLNIQNNSEKYNEADLASGGQIGRYTTQTSLSNVAILCNDNMKAKLLENHIANMFRAEGLDISNRIISFDDLGGTWKTTEDITIQSQETINTFGYFGDYQMNQGDIIPAGSVLTFDVSGLAEFEGSVEEIVPDNQDEFVYIFDVSKVKYRRHTKNMLKQPFYNGEFDEITYWLHYYSFKAISPFYNNVRIGG